MQTDLVITKLCDREVVDRYRFHGRLPRRIRIGRMGKADIRLSDPSASRLVAMIQLNGDRATLHELGTYAGVELNGTTLRAAKAELRGDDVVRIGDTLLHVAWEAEELPMPAVPTQPAPLDAPHPSAQLASRTRVDLPPSPPVSPRPITCPALTPPSRSARTALIEKLAGASEHTAAELDALLARVRADRRVDGSPEPEKYDTHRLVGQMQSEHRRNRGLVLLAAFGMMAGLVTPLAMGADKAAPTRPRSALVVAGAAMVPEVQAPSTPEPAGSPEPPRALAADTERVHTVRAGDTLGSIAAKYLGSATRWQMLHRHNLELLPDPSRLEVGQQLRIPTPETESGH